MEISRVCVMFACIITVITVDGQVEGSFGRRPQEGVQPPSHV